MEKITIFPALMPGKFLDTSKVPEGERILNFFFE